MNFNISDLAPAGRKSANGRFIGHIAAAIAVIMWGFSFVSTKVLIDNNIGPIEIFVYRFTVAYLLILLISHSRFRSHSWRDELLFALCGMLSGSIYFIAENFALENTTATNVSLLTSISPLFTALLMGLFYANERPAKGMYIGSAIAFVGVACVIFNSSAGVEFHPIGDILSLAAAVCWALYSIVLRRLATNYDAWFITRKTFFYGVITSLPFWLMSPGTIVNIDISNTDVIINLLFLAIGASVIGFGLWSVATRALGAVTANNYMYYQSVVTMIGAYFSINEPITLIGVIGCALIIGGLYLGERLSR